MTNIDPQIKLLVEKIERLSSQKIVLLELNQFGAIELYKKLEVLFKEVSQLTSERLTIQLAKGLEEKALAIAQKLRKIKLEVKERI